MAQCAHPEPQLVEITRQGHPTGSYRCRACGAVLGEDGTREVNGL